MKAFSLVVAALIAWAGIASAVILNTSVDGNAGPWQANGSVNSAYEYDGSVYGLPGSPTVVSAANGFDFTAGLSLTVTYVSGTVAVGAQPEWPFTDANGFTTHDSLDNNSWGGIGPSYYMNHGTYPIYASELVGTFANSSGQIVGTPFAIGNSGTFVIPTGASRLQLGVNDVGYGDNSGSWTIQISQVPEPTTAALVLTSLVGFGVATRRVRRTAVR